MLIDTHAHLNFSAYKNDVDEVIKRSLENDVWMINIGSQYETSKKTVEIAEKYSQGVYAAVGLHPIHLNTGLVKMKFDEEESSFNSREEDFNYKEYKELAESERVVAIGEIGLDYYYKPKTKKKLELFKEKQKETFLEQLKLAEELNLPVVFHCRMAHDDLINILNSQFLIHNSKLEGVIHCFTGTWEQAEEYLKMGFYLGFNGIIYKLDLKEIIQKTPLDKILIETDCPYLIPPSAGIKRNEPIYVRYIAEEIAKIKNINYDQVKEKTTKNAKTLFKI